MIASAQTAASASTGGFLDVDWNSIALVCVVTLVAVVAVVTLYSTGMRLLAVGSPGDGSTATSPQRRPVIATIGGYACVGVGILAVLYGVYLVIPLFHMA
ncbi:MAG TPA: hypothetical protein VGM94_14295 [Galbitalea sp.]|jgi:hypothetical protein